MSNEDGADMAETETEPAFKVVFECGNCGAEWDDQYSPRTVIREDGRPQVHNKDCDRLGTTSCDCCTVVHCHICELPEDVEVTDRTPIEGDHDE